MAMTFSGPVEIVEQDDGSERALLTAQVKEAGGQSNAEGSATIQVGGDGGTVDVTERQRRGRLDGRGHRAGRAGGTRQAVRCEPRQGVARERSLLRGRAAVGASSRTQPRPYRGSGDPIFFIGSLAILRGSRRTGSAFSSYSSPKSSSP